MNQEYVRTYDLIHFDWRRTLIENSSDRMAIGLVTGTYNTTAAAAFGSVKNRILEGKINLTLSGYSSDGFGRWLPHLSHSRKTNQFDIQLQDLRKVLQEKNAVVEDSIESAILTSDGFECRPKY